MKLTIAQKIGLGAWVLTLIILVIANKVIALPLLTFGGFVIFGYLAYKSHNSNSNQMRKDGVFLRDTGNVPYVKIGYTWFSAACLVATIVIAIALRLDK